MNVVFLVVVVICLMCYIVFRNMYYGVLDLRYKNKLFKLRDDVCNSHIRVGVNAWFYEYIGESIIRSVRELPSLNLYVMLLLYRKYRKRKYYKINTLIESDDTAKGLFKEYNDIMVEYISKKHFIVTLIPSPYVKDMVSRVVLKYIYWHL
jgi:hypothetical protein